MGTIDGNKRNVDNENKENDNKKNQSENIKRRMNKNLPKIRHVRKSKDILHIHDEGRRVRNNNNDENLTAVIVPIVEYFLSPSESNKPVAVTTKFDLNTVWVEMMIHNEHKKSEIRV